MYTYNVPVPRETSLNSQIIETGEEKFIFRNYLIKLPGISLKKNYRVLTGSVYREPAELKILLYFGLCYENISYRKSACTTDSVSHLRRRTFFIYFCELESVSYSFAYVAYL